MYDERIQNTVTGKWGPPIEWLDDFLWAAKLGAVSSSGFLLQQKESLVAGNRREMDEERLQNTDRKSEWAIEWNYINIWD